MAVALIAGMHDSSEQARQALGTGRVSAGFLTARLAVSEEESLEREYLLERDPQVRAAHAAAGRRATAALRALPGGPALVQRHAAYLAAMRGVLVASDRRRARALDEAQADPRFAALQRDLGERADTVSRQDLPLTLVMLDVDDFKALNSDHGHHAGDERLRELAAALRCTARAADAVYRIGGDEFAVILPGCRAWGGLEFAQRLQRELEGF